MRSDGEELCQIRTSFEESYTHGALLKAFRTGKGFSQKKLGDEIGVDRKTIGLWEVNNQRPKYSDILHLEEPLGLSHEEIDLLLCAAKYQPYYKTPNLEELLKQRTQDTNKNPGGKEVFSSGKVFSREQVYMIVVATILLTIYVFTCLPIFVLIWFQPCTDCPLNYFSNIYLLVALLGGAFGFGKLWLTDRNVGGYPAPLTFYYTALMWWGIGNLIWAIYNAFGYSVPYPSIDDLAFLICNTLCMVGMAMHFKQTAAIQPLRYINFLIRMGVFSIALILLMTQLRGGVEQKHDPIKFYLDVVLPLFSGIFFALLNLWRYDPSFMNLEKSLKSSIRIMRYGAFFLFLADFGFSIGTLVPEHSVLTYANGGWQDFSYATGMLLLSLGSLFISPQSLKHVTTLSEFAEELWAKMKRLSDEALHRWLWAKERLFS